MVIFHSYVKLPEGTVRLAMGSFSRPHFGRLSGWVGDFIIVQQEVNMGRLGGSKKGISYKSDRWMDKHSMGDVPTIGDLRILSDHEVGTYPAWSWHSQFAMENPPMLLSSVNNLFRLGPFSMAMLNNHRVYPNSSLWNQPCCSLFRNDLQIYSKEVKQQPADQQQPKMGSQCHTPVRVIVPLGHKAFTTFDWVVPDIASTRT